MFSKRLGTPVICRVSSRQDTSNLTPGTRTGVIQDEALARLETELQPVEEQLLQLIEEQRRAKTSKAAVTFFGPIQKALKEAILTLPAEEYDWFTHSRRSNV